MAVAQIVLTTAESRKLIAKAVSQLEEVKKALQGFRIILGTSSITPDILEALGFGSIPENERGYYICGMIRQEGLCTTDFDLLKTAPVIDKGRFIEGMKRNVQNFGAGDVYIKSPNILDINGRAGVLVGAPHGGYAGKMFYKLENQEYTIIAPTLLLKSAPIDLNSLTETVNHKTFTRDASEFVRYSCGMPVNLIPFPERTKVVTEIDAIQMIFGLSAKPIGMTGVGSGKDTVILSVEGSAKNMQRFWGYLCNIKGSSEIVTYPSVCDKCPDAKNLERCGGYIKLND